MPSQHLESTKIKPAARVAWTSLMISLKLWKKEGGRFWHSWESPAYGWLFPRTEAESFQIFLPRGWMSLRESWRPFDGGRRLLFTCRVGLPGFYWKLRKSELSGFWMLRRTDARMEGMECVWHDEEINACLW